MRKFYFSAPLFFGGITIGLYKTEVIRHRGPWRNLDEVEFATLDWVHWFNHQRLLEPIGDVPPVEMEMAYHRQQAESAMVARLKQTGLRNTRGGSCTSLGQVLQFLGVDRAIDESE